ncbi:MAG: 4Fe-4S binding protein [Pseudomonadota bacterium]
MTWAASSVVLGITIVTVLAGAIGLALADLLGREALPLAGDLKPATPLLALIDKSRCIGCALCLPACPVATP